MEEEQDLPRGEPELARATQRGRLGLKNGEPPHATWQWGLLRLLWEMSHRPLELWLWGLEGTRCLRDAHDLYGLNHTLAP